jgi:hypothetical protein
MPESDAVAVVRLRPCCPVCGHELEPPEMEMNPGLARPTSLYVPLVCYRGHWQGHGKFWTRQQDEVFSYA